MRSETVRVRANKPYGFTDTSPVWPVCRSFPYQLFQLDMSPVFMIGVLSQLQCTIRFCLDGEIHFGVSKRLHRKPLPAKSKRQRRGAAALRRNQSDITRLGIPILSMSERLPHKRNCRLVKVARRRKVKVGHILMTKPAPTACSRKDLVVSNTIDFLRNARGAGQVFLLWNHSKK